MNHFREVNSKFKAPRMLDIFGWRRRKRDQKLFIGLMRAAQEDNNKKKIEERMETIVKKYNLSRGDNEDHNARAALVASFVVRSAITKNKWDINSMNQNQEFASMILLLVACDYVSQIARIGFEILTMVAGVALFGTREPSRLGSLIREASDEFNRMGADQREAQTIQAIGKCIADWIWDEEIGSMTRLAKILGIMAEAVT